MFDFRSSSKEYCKWHFVVVGGHTLREDSQRVDLWHCMVWEASKWAWESAYVNINLLMKTKNYSKFLPCRPITKTLRLQYEINNNNIMLVWTVYLECEITQPNPHKCKKTSNFCHKRVLSCGFSETKLKLTMCNISIAQPLEDLLG